MPTFKKTERLCSRKLIDELYNTGSAFNAGSVRLIWKSLAIQNEASAKILTVVPKKKLKLSVDRNLVKRRIKEAYRLNKNIIYPFLLERKISLLLAFNYTCNEVLSYDEIEPKIILTLNRLKTAIEKIH
jgi:ribonuclease P protein component